LPQLATVKECADYYRVSARTVYEWVRKEAVTVRRVGAGRHPRLRIVMDEAAKPSPEI
jgi:excisionase family DNA binding protein